MARGKPKVSSNGSKPACSSRPSSKKAVDPLSPLKLKELVESKTKQYLHSENTTEKYDGYIKRAKEFLASFVQDEDKAVAEWKAQPIQGLSADGEDEI